MDLRFKNERVLLRALEPEDIDFLYMSENSADLWGLSELPVFLSKFVLKEYIREAHRDVFEAKQCRLVIVDAGNPEKTVGLVDLFELDFFHLRAGVGILLREECRGRGYASAALSLMEDYAFSLLKMRQLFCHIAVSNKESLRLFEGAGFSVSGRKKDWVRKGEGFEDVWFLQKVKG
ncbi:MAG: GNAT family N-acetyltransferase [Bacteroidia bacterium]|nr:MAG: GNAT family N-acetyltransferase [Bacteroidia bacterium]